MAVVTTKVNTGIDKSTQPTPYNAGTQGHMMVLLSGGTLIMVLTDTTPNLEFYYSTDEGDTWTKCATELATASSSQYAVTVDEFDNIFVIHQSAASTIQVRRVTFTGTDITGGATWSRGGTINSLDIMAIDNPTIAGNVTHVLILLNVAGNIDAYQNTFDRDTGLWSTDHTLATTGTSGTGTSSDVNIVLECDPASLYKAKTPSDPRALLIYTGGSANATGYRYLTWDAVNHRWQGSTNGNVTHGFGMASSASQVGLFDPVKERVFLGVGGTSVGSAHISQGVTWGTAPSVAFTSVDFTPMTLDASVYAVWVNPGTGSLLYAYCLENDDTANIDVHEVEIDVFAPASPVDTQSSFTAESGELGWMRHFWAWNGGYRVFGALTVSDSLEAAPLRNMIVLYKSFAFEGSLVSARFGMLPIGG